MDSDSDEDIGHGPGLRATDDSKASLDLSPFEERLRQQTESLIEARRSEIEAYRASLNETLGEVQRLRAVEQAHLATRVKAAHDACNKRMEELNKDYRQQVELLQGRTQAYIEQLRHESENMVIQRVAALSSTSPNARRLDLPNFGQPSLPSFLTPQAHGNSGGLGGTISAHKQAAHSPLSAGHMPRGPLATPLAGVQKGMFGSPGPATAFDRKWTGSPNALHRTTPKVLDLLLEEEDR